MKLLYALLILVVLFISSTVAKVSKPSNQTVEERVREAVKLYENNWSGFPINCRKLVDTLASDGVLEYPTGKNIIGGGHKRIYNRCEAFILENFSQMITYAHEPMHIIGREVAFERTTAFVTKTNCRFYNRGIVTIKYDKDFKIKQLKDYFNADELLAKYESCQFPGTDLPDINAGNTNEDKQTEKPVEPTKTEKPIKDELNFGKYNKNSIKEILDNLPNPEIEKDKFLNNEENDRYSFLKGEKSKEFKGQLDSLRFPHEIYQDKLQGILEEDEKEDGGKKEYLSMSGLKATIHSKSGSIFEGQVNTEGIPNGFGELELKNGDFYLGYFENGKKHGKGRLISVSGCQYDGDWKDDMHDGYGRFDENDKQISYQGEWKENERHGKGVLTDPKSEIKGIWEHDQLIFGHEVKKNVQLEYFGEFKNDQWHGNGKVSFPDGSIYQGQFENGSPSGKGKFIKIKSFEDQDDVEGNDFSERELQITENENWMNGVVSGTGRIYTKGWCCEGVWNDNEIQNGRLMIQGYGIYEGDINRQLLPHGTGKEYMDNGDYYHGHFINGERNGYGEAIWDDKSQYLGQWIRGLRVGKGKITSGDITIDGDFKEILLENGQTKLNAKGTLTKPDGSIYIGELEDGLASGYGEFKSSHDHPTTTIKGIWLKGKLIKQEE
ncbi:hypothetical protein RB653_002763 [Dictyostelium firmibasis]|uniref:MORN repeat protein n=1 Tax=Dictyostelium firmibasis TaxID=79012 RepID=A0AAN7U3G6_9MYCE